jgi:integrase/recombinase XerD
MNPFESFLAEKLEEYIVYRKKLGYKEKALRQPLLYFDRYLQTKKCAFDSFTPSFFLKFRESLQLNGRTVNAIICCVRGFFKYLQRIDDLDENPLLDIPHVKECAFIPFVFSPEQTELLLVTIQKRIRQSEKHFLYDLAEYVAFFLLVHCGLRISEPLRLLRSHFRPQEASIYIEKTKFAKDRLIPIPKRVVGEIENYLAVRRSFLGEDQSPYLLLCGKDKQLTRFQLYPTFHGAIKSMGLDQKKQTIGQTTFGRPTPHSLRHPNLNKIQTFSESA